MVPAGALIYLGLNRVLRFTHFAPQALAFSAGTFLYIAVSDLLPHVNRHGKQGRARTLLALILGLLVMFALTFVTESG
jgi:zinc and cadmium transporter